MFSFPAPDMVFFSQPPVEEQEQMDWVQSQEMPFNNGHWINNPVSLYYQGEILYMPNTVPLIAPSIPERTYPCRRGPHTLPRDEATWNSAQPILHMAWDAFEYELKNRCALWKSYRLGSLADPIINPSQFIAEYMVKHMSPEVFRAGNQPRFGPSPKNTTGLFFL
ncbi:uncharacterized protein LOC108103320 [Drosophila eugracilis]|uniref:uncharacterized protein LOC108103320 n=1 Tax=Drosophila eugracilis TaxID=29029 RepID=UPI0007E71DE3|nr:uncharacterized protein LOC108103320 [Drosophila eugracilis]